MAMRGHKVLVIDFDPNNSATLFYTRGIENINNLIETHNIFEMLSHNDAKANIIQSRIKNIDIIPSHLNIFKLRSMGYNELQKSIKNIQDEYDYIIIDTAPTYDNILINVLLVSDYIFTPIELNSDNITTTKFLQKQLYDDCEAKVGCWYILISYWKEAISKFPNSMQSQFEALFNQMFSNILDVHIPFTNIVKRYVELDDKVSTTVKDNSSKAIAIAYNQLANMIEGKDANDESAWTTRF